MVKLLWRTVREFVKLFIISGVLFIGISCCYGVVHYGMSIQGASDGTKTIAGIFLGWQDMDAQRRILEKTLCLIGVIFVYFGIVTVVRLMFMRPVALLRHQK